jgi:hypothetical protein
MHNRPADGVVTVLPQIIQLYTPENEIATGVAGGQGLAVLVDAKNTSYTKVCCDWRDYVEIFEGFKVGHRLVWESY